MPSYSISLGEDRVIHQLYPDPSIAVNPTFSNYQEVIKHYTGRSLQSDGIAFTDLEVNHENGAYIVEITTASEDARAEFFADRLEQIFSKEVAQKAIVGADLLKKLNVWNPMAGYHVNGNEMDGDSKWALFPPLGLNVIGQKGLLLMHYPPWTILQAGRFDNSMTMKRWVRILECADIPDEDVARYKTIVDINPIAAPGEGESEYPNDYFPIMMASGFFDGGPDRDYIKSMLDLYLTPPGWPEENKYTIPLIICGSPLYDPQAPGWFRTAYTDILPQNSDGVPTVDVLQTGTFKVFPDSKRETPFMIANHMIAAGVTGKCTNDPSKIPDIRKYEAQDLVAATFLKLYADDPNREPEDVKREACQKWFGASDGKKAAQPPEEKDRAIICALAQMDLFYEAKPQPHPKYTMKEAMDRCKNLADPLNDPCAKAIEPTGPKGNSN